MMRNWEGSAESFQKAYELDPTYRESIRSYWPAFYNTASAYLAAERSYEALAMLETGKSILPSRPEFDQMIGQIALNAHEYDDALISFESSIVLLLIFLVPFRPGWLNPQIRRCRNSFPKR